MFIGFEKLARWTVARYSIHEFWIMLLSFFGWVAMIAWIGTRTAPAAPADSANK